jgi:replication initiation protein RepC
MKDSPNGKRYGRRDAKGRIVEAYGFDLSPLAARHMEFVRLAEEGRAEREAMGRLRRRATIARKGIVQILETARDYGLKGEEWVMLERDAHAIVQALKRAEGPDEMEAGVASLEQRQSKARTGLEMLLKEVKMTPSGVENEPYQYTYKLNPYPQKDTVIATNHSSEPAEPSVPQSPVPEPRPGSEKSVVHGIHPDELVRLAPRLKPYLRCPNPTWPDLIDAADWLRHDLGVSKPLWGDACLAMGRELAAVALAIVSTKEAEHFRSSPGGYFHGMVAKAKAGELHLSGRCGPCAALQSRNTSGRAGEGAPIAATGAGRDQACRYGHHPFPAAGSGASMCGLPTVHSGASGVRLSPPSGDRAGGIPGFRPKAACQAG